MDFARCNVLSKEAINIEIESNVIEEKSKKEEKANNSNQTYLVQTTFYQKGQFLSLICSLSPKYSRNLMS